MYPQSSKGLNKETKRAVYFFTTAFHPLDNYSAHTIRIWGKTFPTAEHAFQWKKFSTVHKAVAKQIFKQGSPEAAKQVAKKHKGIIPQKWFDVRVSVMKNILTAKAKQHDDVREVLRKSKRRIIIENSPIDSFWGIGKDGNGQNIVGKIWMEIRKNYT